MANGTRLNPGSGGDLLQSNDRTAYKVAVHQIAHGPLGSDEKYATPDTPLPVGRLAAGTPVVASQTGANAILTLTLAGAVGKTTYIEGITISGLGATAAGSVQVTMTGPATGPIVTVPIPAGVGLGVGPIHIPFPSPIPASATNTAIVVTVPAFGSGNAVASATAYGFQV